MARPRKWYVVWLFGRIAAIVHGRAAALSISDSFESFRTERDAQEFATWWDYRHGRH